MVPESVVSIPTKKPSRPSSSKQRKIK
jgi:hypothetical protein